MQFLGTKTKDLLGMIQVAKQNAHGLDLKFPLRKMQISQEQTWLNY